MSITSKATVADVFTNARLKFFPTSDGLKLWSVTCFPEPIFRKNGFEEIGEKPEKTCFFRDKDEKTQDNSVKNRKKSYNRAKNNLFDLLMCNNDCGYFVTLTFDGEKVNRFSYSDIVRKTGQFLDNGVRRKDLRYILVPEFHKNGAIHFHGLMNAEALGLTDAVSPHTGRKIKRKGKQVYNIRGFKHGFSTAIRIGEAECERQAVAKYVFKYITKIGDKVGGRYYLSGGNLKRPTYKLVDINYFDVPCEPFTLDFGGECKVLRVNDSPDIDLTFLGV